MSQDFEHILEDNICLKKSLQVARHQNDKLQQQVSQLRFNFQQLLDKNTALNQTYNQFQKKNQLQVAEHNKNITTLVSQIQQLKTLIEQKQMELQNFQIKIIPNLDQDMIRVKLITEMEGPYQQIVQKKDQEIYRLKQKLAEMERKFNIVELRLQTKQKQLKRQLEQTKNFYQNQNERLLKQLNSALNKREIKTYDKELMKNQRKQLEQLRCMIDIHSVNQGDLRRQLTNAKIQKERILLQLSQINQKKALELHLSSQNAELRAIKQQKQRAQEQILKKNGQIEKLEKKIKTIQRQYRNNEQQQRRNHNKNRQQWQYERQALKNELRKQKEDLNKINNLKQKIQDNNQELIQKIKHFERQNQLKRQECQRYKIIIQDLQRDTKQYQLAKKRKISLTKNLVNEDAIQKHKRSQQTAKKQNNNKTINQGNEQKSNSYVNELQKVNIKLKQKLDLANRKIVDLLKEKAGNLKADNNMPDMNESNSRDRTFSNVEINNAKPKKDKKQLLLEYRDSSFAPLVPPTIYTHFNRF